MCASLEEDVNDELWINRGYVEMERPATQCQGSLMYTYWWTWSPLVAQAGAPIPRIRIFEG